MRKYIPASTKRSLRLFQRWLRFQLRGYHFAQIRDDLQTAQSFIQIKQEIKKSYLFENKLHNIRLASAQVASYTIRTGEIFSFWRAVGSPNAASGYKKGRNIINGRLQEDFGGGLCQLSGLIYHLALLGNLAILERHNHSLDLYNDTSRYAPIGTDATVVYGYKDLIIKNNLPHDIQFCFLIENGDSITGQLGASGQLKARKLSTKIRHSGDLIHVELFDDQMTIVSKSVYRKPPP